jgi:heme oxygenase
VLAGRVGAGLPRRYFSAIHQPGDWLAFQSELDQAARGPLWIQRAIAAARAAFARFGEAAASEMSAAF